MGRAQVVKGKAWEREVAQLLRPIFGADVHRGIGQARAGNEVADVDLPAGTFWPECKVGARTNPRAALAQALEASAGTGKTPVAICKDDRQRPTATMYLDDWIQLLAQIRDPATGNDTSGSLDGGPSLPQIGG